MKLLRKAGLLSSRRRVLSGRVVLLGVIFATTLNNVPFTMNGII